MSVLLRLKEGIAKKSKLFYFTAGALSVIGLLFITANLFFTSNTNAAVDEKTGRNFSTGL